MNTKTSSGCTCGCGGETKSNYKAGHDARHVSLLVGELLNTIQDGGKVTTAMITSAAKALPSAALQAKFRKAAERMIAKASTPAPTKVEADK